MNSEELKKIYKKKDKVAIIGFADSWNQAPFNDPEFEVWGLNSLFELIPRQDIWFEIHDKKTWENNKEIGLGLTRNGKPYKDALIALNIPILMTDKYPDIPNSLRYPLEEMICKFDPLRRKSEWVECSFEGSAKTDWNGYFTNSISYMIALAIDWAYSEIHVYGVDMATSGPMTGNGEYAMQRPSCEYYLGIAMGRGIKTFIPAQADLLKCRFIYGWEEERQTMFEQKLAKVRASMDQRFNAAQQTYELSRKQMDQYIGATEAIKEMSKIWSNCAG